MSSWICISSSNEKDGGEGQVKLFPADSGRLVTANEFDRETTPSVNFQLVCYVSQMPKSNPIISQPLFVVKQNVTLIIADEDDNPPRLQSPDQQSVVDVYLKDKGIVLVSPSILQTDSLFDLTFAFHCLGQGPFD